MGKNSVTLIRFVRDLAVRYLEQAARKKTHLGSTPELIRYCRAYFGGKPSLSIPCYGERRFGHAQDDELAIGIPVDDFKRVADNLETLYNRGIRYPISQFGATVNVEPALKMAYNLAEME